jgi:hypothetical protein
MCVIDGTCVHTAASFVKPSWQWFQGLVDAILVQGHIAGLVQAVFDVQ